MTKQEFKKLFEQYYNPLCNFASTILYSSSKAEDAVQDVFIKMWQKKDTLGGLENVKAYLFTATKNKCFEYLRKLKLERKLSEENESRLEMSSSINIDDEADKWELAAATIRAAETAAEAERARATALAIELQMELQLEEALRVSTRSE